jgi:hypothetical protein
VALIGSGIAAVAVAAVAGTLAFRSGHDQATPPPAAARATSPAVSSAGPGSSATAGSSAAAGGSATTPHTTTTPAPAASGAVPFAPGVSAAPHAQQVEDLFTTYFGAINGHNYTEYASTLDAGYRAKNPQSTFDNGYSGVADSGERIDSITSSGSGLTVVITFTSHQPEAISPDRAPCNHYTLALPLVSAGAGYVIAAPPPGDASWTTC